MFFSSLVFAFLAAFIFAVVIAGIVGWRHPADRAGDGVAGPILFVFLILFLSAWVGGVWLRPIGPAVWGVTWLPFFLVALVVGLILLAVASPPRRPVTASGERDVAASAAVFGGFFWLLMGALLIALMLAYFL